MPVIASESVSPQGITSVCGSVIMVVKYKINRVCIMAGLSAGENVLVVLPSVVQNHLEIQFLMLT